MEARLRPQVPYRLITIIIRQRKKDIEEIEKIEKYRRYFSIFSISPISFFRWF